MSKYRGFSLIEIVVAISLFAMIFSSLVILSVNASRSLVLQRERDIAVEQIDQIYSKLLVIRKHSWSDIVASVGGDPYHIELVSGAYRLVAGEATEGDVTYSITIAEALRDNGVLSELVGTADGHTYLVTFSTDWTDYNGNAQSKTQKVYMNDWVLNAWIEDIDADFTDGIFTLSLLEPAETGRIQLQTEFYPDWCKPELTLTTFDLTGQGYARDISAISSEIVTGTGENASGDALTKITNDQSDPPILTEVGNFDGHKTNDVAVTPGFVVLGTDTNGSEMVIIQTSTLPYSEVGFFDVTGPKDIDRVEVSGDVAYAQVDSVIYTVDVSSMSGERFALDSVDLGATPVEMHIAGDYLYLAMDSSPQFIIVDISDPVEILKVNELIVTGEAGKSITANDDGTVAYLATANSAVDPEVFIIDTATPLTTITELATYDTGAMDPAAIVTVPGVDTVIVGGIGGVEYQVVEVDDPSSPLFCGDMEIDTEITSLASVEFDNGNKYTYVLTRDSASEIKVVKGGAGGGGADGNGYQAVGNYISNVYDTGLGSPTYFSLSMWAEIVAGTDVNAQIRAGDTNDLSALPWIGPDGTASTFFTTSGGATPSSINGHRYVQYKVFLDSDTILTPFFDKLSIYYQ